MNNLYIFLNRIERVNNRGDKRTTPKMVFLLTLLLYGMNLSAQSSIGTCQNPFSLCGDIVGGGVLIGFGENNTTGELDDLTCYTNCASNPNMMFPVWFKGTCSKSGTLEFRLLNFLGYNIDFAVYRLPNGTGSCTGKQLLRCMAASDVSPTSPCMGPTGLLAGETDISGPCGCTGNPNNWLAPIDMVAGESYALVVLNSSISNDYDNSFILQLEGTGEFAQIGLNISASSPEACPGEPIEFKVDSLTFPYPGLGSGYYTWNFGINAPPLFVFEPAPQTVIFGSSGVYPITLSVNAFPGFGCEVTDTQYVIINPNPFIEQISTEDSDCYDSNNGSISVAVSSGNLPYNYQWITGETDSLIQNLSAGSFGLTVTDAKGCSVTASASVSEPLPLTVATIAADVKCAGDASGSISATASGGTLPFTYQWNNGAATSSIQSLSVGTYTLTVMDANGCTSETSAVVSDVAPINVVEKTTDVTCNGIPDGTITIGVTGGSAPFTYQWSNGATSSDLIGLSAGTYTVTLTDNNQCTLVASANIVELAPISISTTQYSISCFGKSDGYIASTVTGGVGPYIYYWSEKSISSDIDSLPAGIYELTITDAQGCTATTSASITEPPLLTLVATEVAITCYGAGNGAASAIASGGTGPYNYLWSNGTSGASITNLSPGIYILTATDSKGCTALVSSNITEPAVLSSTINASNATCFGANDGTLTTISAGGTLPYAYQWSNGASNASLRLCCMNLVGSQIFPIPFRPQATFTDLGAAI